MFVERFRDRELEIICAFLGSNVHAEYFPRLSPPPRQVEPDWQWRIRNGHKRERKSAVNNVPLITGRECEVLIIIKGIPRHNE